MVPVVTIGIFVEKQYTAVVVAVVAVVAPMLSCGLQPNKNR